MCVKFFERGNILVPIDGSDGCHKALSFAIELSRKYGSELTLVHVVQHSATLLAETDIFEAGYSEIDAVLEESGKQILKNCSEETNKQGIKVNTKLLRGHPGTQIVNYSKEGGFSLIVMGNRGLSGLKRILLGSVSDYVSDHAECSVLIVK